MDRAGKQYWDALWETAHSGSRVEPAARDLNHYIDRKFHEFFCDTFRSIDTRGKSLLEIGCGNSSWLPYFAREFGFCIWGLDYSEQGCEQERLKLAAEGVVGEVVCADFFNPPALLLGAFDVVVSFGVVEHFDDTSACLAAFAKCLKPGGMLITNIPNMSGLIGKLQKLINRPVYDIHVPLDVYALSAAHPPSCDVIACRYFLFANWSVVNLADVGGRLVQEVFRRGQSWFSKGCWILERWVPIMRPNRLTSPYIHCVARKSCA